MKGAKKEASMSLNAKIIKRCPRAPSKPKLVKIKRSGVIIGVQLRGTRKEAKIKPIKEVYKKFVDGASSLLKYFVVIK